MRKFIAAAFAGITLGMVALWAPTAQATTPDTPSVCRTGNRDHGDYNRLCLHTGTPRTARGLWFSTPEGHGKVKDDDMTRRGICKFAGRHGGITAAAIDLVTDMTYDNYRNNGQVNRWVAQDARLDCQQMGYRV